MATKVYHTVEDVCPNVARGDWKSCEGHEVPTNVCAKLTVNELAHANNITKLLYERPSYLH